MRSAFTLIELLVVVVILVVLMALLLPAMEEAVDRAKSAACGSNLHAVGLALTLHGADWNQSYPQIPYWGQLMGKKGIYTPQKYSAHDVPKRPLNAYLGFRTAGTEVPPARCPSDRGDARYNIVNAYEQFGNTYIAMYGLDFSRVAWAFGSNGTVDAAVDSRKAGLWESTHNKVLVADWTFHGNALLSQTRNRWHDMKLRRHNVLFADYHVELLQTDPSEIEGSGWDFYPPNSSWKWW